MKNKWPRESEGLIKRHPDGFGFFISDEAEQEDVYIPRQAMAGVMTNDRVRVLIERERGGDRFRGEVIAVVKRSTERVVGAMRLAGTGRGILPDKSLSWGEDLKVSFPPEMSPKEGELVVARIESYPDSPRGFSGRVISVIGPMADPMNDSLRMLHAHNIPFEFTQQTLSEANAMSDEVLPRDIAGRKDLRGLPIVTIDGKTAKDFDDAVFTESTANGFHTIVAIADVSHYVKMGTAMDADAYLRGTSTYFPNFVAPMLPEKLSNGLCSLRPKVARLALVADMQLSFDGDVISSEFYEAVIESQARVTYGEAQEIVDGRTPESLRHVASQILKCADLAKILMAKRFREGSLDLDLPETEIEIDESGMPVDIMQTERLFAHRLIEELMLLANVAVAKFFEAKKIPAIYRIHEQPAVEAMQNFNNFLKVFGYKEKLAGGLLQKKITRALEFFKGHPKESVLHTLALRSLAQAKYSADNVGHFGLGFQFYTHFTSPIRRYPDLIVHRLLKTLLYPGQGYRPLAKPELDTAGTMLSACEQRSVKAERQIKSIKKARFMTKFIGQEFDGMVSSVTRFGLFASLRQYDVDGLIRLEDLGGDRYEFDEEKLRLVGRKSGRAFEVGDPIRILVAKSDIEVGQIDFVLAGVTSKPSGFASERRAEHPSRQGKKAEKSKHAEKGKRSFSKRSSPEKDSQRPGKSRVSRSRRPR